LCSSSVIPAQAGIQVLLLDSRLRENDKETPDSGADIALKMNQCPQNTSERRFFSMVRHSCRRFKRTDPEVRPNADTGKTPSAG
jgi:hypothetical protein